MDEETYGHGGRHSPAQEDREPALSASCDGSQDEGASDGVGNANDSPGQPQQHFCYTIHQWAGKPDLAPIREAIRLAVVRRDISYFIGQLERCPKTGSLHIQCYVQV